MDDQINETLADISDAILDRSVTFTITRKNKQSMLLDVLPFVFFKRPEKEKFSITGATMGTMIKISRELLALNMEGFDKNTILNSTYEVIEKHGERMAKIIAYAIVNRKEEPPAHLVNFLLYNLTAEELKKLLEIALAKINATAFLHSIIMVKGLAIMNPTEHRG